jgi:hypothetical protein
LEVGYWKRWALSPSCGCVHLNIDVCMCRGVRKSVWFHSRPLMIRPNHTGCAKEGRNEDFVSQLTVTHSQVFWVPHL